MTTLGTGARSRNGRCARLVWKAHYDETDQGAEDGVAPPYRLLWSIGIMAFVLCTAAFALWGLYGANILVDLIAALCF